MNDISNTNNRRYISNMRVMIDCHECYDCHEWEMTDASVMTATSGISHMHQSHEWHD